MVGRWLVERNMLVRSPIHSFEFHTLYLYDIHKGRAESSFFLKIMGHMTASWTI